MGAGVRLGGPPAGLLSITVSDPPMVSRSLCGPIPRHSPPEPQKQERRTHERQYTRTETPTNHQQLPVTTHRPVQQPQHHPSPSSYVSHSLELTLYDPIGNPTIFTPNPTQSPEIRHQLG